MICNVMIEFYNNPSRHPCLLSFRDMVKTTIHEEVRLRVKTTYPINYTQTLIIIQSGFHLARINFLVSVKPVNINKELGS
jgi:hypothetical protein